MMRLQRHSDMGAIDAVGKQFVMGSGGCRTPSRLRYASWQTPKLASSISHVFGKPDDVTMVEIFGARGQDITYPEMKWWTDHMQVSGVNLPDPAFVQSPRAVRHGLPALFLQRRLRAALAAVSSVCRLHVPAEPDAHRRPARLPGGPAVQRQSPAGGQVRSRPRT